MVDSVAFFDEVESDECTHGAPVVKMDILFQPLSRNRNDQRCLRCAYDRCRTTFHCGTGTTTRQRDRKISAEFFSNTMHDGHFVHDMALRVFCYPSAQTLLQTESSTLCGANPGHVRDFTGTGCPHSCFRPMLYAVASTISLFSLQLAEMIDLMRDLYEVRIP